MGDELVAIHVWHHDIQQYKVRVTGVENLKRFPAVISGDNLESLAG